MSDIPTRFGISSRHLLAWVVAALLVRLTAWFWAGPSLACSYDECSYLDLARTLASGGGFATEKGFLWPPGYTLFLALLVPMDGAAAGLARLIQSVLGALLVLPAAAFAQLAARPAHGDEGAATGTPAVVHGAAAFVALDPTLVAFSHLLWPETLFMLLFTTGVVLLLRRPGAGQALLAGVLLGLAALVRSVGFWLTLPLLFLALRERGARRWTVPALVLVAVLGVIAPWTARNAARYGRFVFIDATLGTNLYLGNTDAPPVTWDWGAPVRSRVRDPARARCWEGDFIDRDRCEVKAAAGWMLAHPAGFLSRAVTKWADLVNPTSFLVRHVRAGRYRGTSMGEVSPVAASVATAASGLPWVALALLAIVGLFIDRPSPARRTTVLLVVCLLVVHAFTFGMSRFRLPLMPFLAAYAALGAVALRRGQGWPAAGNDRLSMLLVFVTLAYLWGLRLVELLDFSPLRFP